MGLIRTDDAARRLEFVLLGPPGFRLVVDTTPVVWGLWLAGSVFGWATAWALLPGMGWFFLFGSWSAPALSALVVRAVRPYVDRVTPALYYARTALAEVRAPRPVSPEPVTYETTFDVSILTPVYTRKKGR